MPTRLSALHRRRLGLTGVSHMLVQKRVICPAITDCCFVAAALAWPRARLATLWAPLNHRLMNGFFLSMGSPLAMVSRGLIGKASTPSLGA